MEMLAVPVRWRVFKPMLFGAFTLLVAASAALPLSAEKGSTLRLVLAGVFATMGTGLLVLKRILFGRPPTANLFFQKVFFEFLLKKPQLLSQMKPMGLDLFPTLLNDYGVEEMSREARYVTQAIEHLGTYEEGLRSEGQGISYDVLDFFLRDLQDFEGERFAHHHYVLNQMTGAHLDVPEFLCSFHAVTNWQQARRYVARVRQISQVTRQVSKRVLMARIRAGNTPLFVLERVAAQLRAFAQCTAEENVLYKSLLPKLSALARPDVTTKARLAQELLNVVRYEVQPSYSALLDVVYGIMRTYHGLEGVYAAAYAASADATPANPLWPRKEPNAIVDHGVWKLKHGDQFYWACLRHHTTTDLSPVQIHKIGLRAVGDLQAEAVGVCGEINRGKKAPKDFAAALAVAQALRKDPLQLYSAPNDDAAREMIIADYKAMIGEAEEKSKELFARMPRQAVAVERMPVMKESGSPAAYYFPPALNGSKPGTFYANLRSPKEVVKWEMRTLAFHEAVPGHHFQLALAQELPLPFFRRVVPFTAYMEGYALYAEALAFEHGLQPTPHDRLGYLAAQLFRAARLVVDTGIHFHKWTREKAIEYMEENTLVAHDDAVTEVERYFVMPGQACAYYIGFERICALRKEAMAKLGDKFDLKSFHSAILMEGALPLTVLEAHVNAWIKSEVEKGATS